jgi:hypothetical protein
MFMFILILLCIVTLIAFCTIAFNVFVLYSYLRWERTIDKGRYMMTTYVKIGKSGQLEVIPKVAYSITLSLDHFLQERLYLPESLRDKFNTP